MKIVQKEFSVKSRGRGFHLIMGKMDQLEEIGISKPELHRYSSNILLLLLVF